jgi:hypothetical protein
MWQGESGVDLFDWMLKGKGAFGRLFSFLQAG